MSEEASKVTLYSGYVNEEDMIFKVGKYETHKDENGNYKFDTCLKTSTQTSTPYLTLIMVRDVPINLTYGRVVYSLNKETVVKFVEGEYERIGKEAKERYEKYKASIIENNS